MAQREINPKNRGNVAAVLIVLDRISLEQALVERLRELSAKIEDPTDRSWAAMRYFVTHNEGQIKGQSGTRVTQILSRSGIFARYLGKDGGRSSRGNFRAVRRLLESIPRDVPAQGSFIDEIKAVQRAIVDQLVQPELECNPIRIPISRDLSSREIIDRIMTAARVLALEGQVAQHLVGAKLKLRFPEDEIDNHSVSTKDSLGAKDRPGDFLVGKRVFHVTVAFDPDMNRRFDENLEEGFHVKLLVPSRSQREVQLQLTSAKVEVEPLEGYVANNLQEMGRNRPDAEREKIDELVALYNQRVIDAERSNCGIELTIEWRD
jgi:hypothetical protein